MNYFELFNKVMLELNYRKITVFQNIFKSEHLRILENLNRVNSEVTGAFDWPFLMRKLQLSVNAGDSIVENAVNGRVLKVYEGTKKLIFNPFYENFYQNTSTAGTYGVFDDKLLLSPENSPRTLDVYYLTDKIAKGADGSLKELMTLETDESILPNPFAEQILVYGTCIKTKANPSFAKFPFWNLMFKNALVNLRATCSLSFEDTPSVKIRQKGAKGAP